MRFFFSALAIPFQIAIRTQEIVFTFSRFGLLGSLSALGMEVGKRGVTFSRITQFDSKPFDAVFGRNFAKTLMRLGPTFIKLGQVLATRPEWVGLAVAEELRVLFDKVDPISYRKIEKILKKELGKDRFKDFKQIEKAPLASASLSQTHKAVLKNGASVILKVQKPKVAETVKADLAILELWIRSLQLIFPQHDLNRAFKDFKEATLREIDYRKEAENLDRFHHNYKKIFSATDVVFPGYYKEYLTEKVIVLEPLKGKKVSSLKKGSFASKKAALESVTAILEQIFDHGFFHADPHAGNIFYMEESGRVGFVDMGLVGQLQPEDKKKFLKVILALLKRDKKQLAEKLFELGTANQKTVYAKFENEIENLIEETKKKGVKDLKMEFLISELLKVAKKNHVDIPNRYVLMIRASIVIEGVAKSLDPDISIFKIALPIVSKSLLKSYNPFRKLFK